jgi:hypothetical protein
MEAAVSPETLVSMHQTTVWQYWNRVVVSLALPICAPNSTKFLPPLFAAFHLQQQWNSKWCNIRTPQMLTFTVCCGMKPWTRAKMCRRFEGNFRATMKINATAPSETPTKF